jgi:transglutaminase-like putative cysteine protease
VDSSAIGQEVNRMTVRILFLSTFLAVSLVAVFAVAESSPVETPASPIKTSDPVVYHIKVETTFVVPEGNNEIDQVRIFQALPTRRRWDPPGAAQGATEVQFTPKEAKKLVDSKTGARYVLWTVNGRQKPGTKLTLTTTMTVSSPKRTFDVENASVSWDDYAKRPTDKTAVVDLAGATSVHPELAKVAAQIKADYSPPEAVLEMCKWIVKNIKYDASVPFATSDVNSIVANKCGQCGHRAVVLRQLTAAVGIPFRTAWGMYLRVPDGRKDPLVKIRSDYSNEHSWGEVYFPGIGWVEVDSALGAKAFAVRPYTIQNNRWFENYAIWFREAGANKRPTWTPVAGGFKSDYGVENFISFSKGT